MKLIITRLVFLGCLLMCVGQVLARGLEPTRTVFDSPTEPFRPSFSLSPLSAGRPLPVATSFAPGLPHPWWSADAFWHLLDTTPIIEREGDFMTSGPGNPIDLRDPAAVTQEIEYDPATNRYLLTERIGDAYFRAPTYLTFEEYQAYRERQRQNAYFDRLQGVSTGQPNGLNALADPIDAVDVENSLIDRLFGGQDINIQTRGNIDLTLGGEVRYTDNPNLIRSVQRQFNPLFQMNIQLNVTGSIGTKLTLSSNYNTQSNFQFDNQTIKVAYNAAEFSEDEIIQDIQFGNVSLPLRSNLIQGSTGLFGVRTDMKFGDLRVTAIGSQQKTKRGEIEIKGGAQYQEFSVRADEYDENRHFFLNHYNRDQFEGALINLPNITSLFKINRIEVWLTNDRDQTEGVRDLIALADLGEPDRLTNPNATNLNLMNGRDIAGRLLPDNEANELYENLLSTPSNRLRQNIVGRLQGPPYRMEQSRDFERVRARLLSANEFSYHPDLGFISVNVNVRPDQVLAVAYEYTYGGKVYKVGEFSNDLPVGDTSTFNVLYTRMLKSTTPRVDVPTWDLMMKNFYNIGAYQVNREDFRLDITYEDPGGGQKRFLPTSNLANIPLIRVFNLDQLNVQLDPTPDGIFDFVPDLTIYPRNGRIMFPVLEPFGKTLRDRIIEPNEASEERRYVYSVLYDSTVVRAREYPEFNRFIIRGSYKSSVSNEISLGAFNVPKGSVRVTAGGQILREDIDYEINYGIGRIKILNDAYLNSGVPIRASFEDNSVFGNQNRSMLGLRADYEVKKNLSIGGTFLQMKERPFTQKVNIGDDPINNRIFGLDVLYGGEAPWLTRLVDKLPGISTREMSTINLSAEGAFLKPGHSKAINVKKGEGGTVYVDDFEGSASGFDLKTPINRWRLASVPQGNSLFPEASRPLITKADSLSLQANRALINWYRLDQSGGGVGRANDPYTYQVAPQELYPGRQNNPYAANNFLFTFDLSYYPNQRGPYNFDVPGGYAGVSEGLTGEGLLARPETRWGGIMRDLQTNDFQAANIEYLEFWMLSPFLEGNNTSNYEGDLYIEFGNISEDVIRDSRLFFENGLPSGDPGSPNSNRPFDLTTFGRVPRLAPIVQAFDNDPETRVQQDLGYDGLDDAGELVVFQDWLATLAGLTPAALQAIQADPANDNFQTFLGNTNTSGRENYLRFNGPQGNSPLANGTGLAANSTNLPDSEDVNGDNTLSETETYFQYRIPLRIGGPNGEIDEEAARYITQVRELEPQPGGGGSRERPRMLWYRFKMPLDQYDAKIGSIQDFRSIRFMRMYMTGFESPVTLRFARLDLVRNQWRRYLRNDALRNPGPRPTPVDANVLFDIDAVNFEENAGREPFRYVLPEGIEREQQLNGPPGFSQNEQSQVITVCNLADGDARAIYKIVNLDMRVYDRLRMFVHAEEFDAAGTGVAPELLEDGDTRLFVRLGSDFKDNFYEYELPLTFSRVEDLGDPARLSAVVWPTANDLDIDLKGLVALKEERNRLNEDLRTFFSRPVPGDTTRRIAVIGNPNLGLVKGVLIGIRNPDGGAETICSQIWVNELRLNGLDERGGAAGQARLDLQLADFGTVSASASASTIGWGALDQKLADRARSSTVNYDVTGTFELGKFLPEASGVRIPATLVYADNVKTPEYDPYDLDIKLKDKLAKSDNRDSIREQAVDRVVQREVNFTNVRKDRTSTRVPLPWDISNFSASYVRNETDRTSPLIELDEVLNHYGSLDYNYALRAKPIEPFKNLIKNDKYFNLLRELNFNPVPSRLAVSTTMDRVLQATRYRFSGDDPSLNTFYNRNWTWDRDYNLAWDFSKGLRFQFNATNRAVIDELPTFQENGTPYDDAFRLDSVWAALRNGGRNKAYQHRFDVNYTLPTKQIPYLDFLTVTAQYAGSYNWNAGALNLQDSLGNVIANGQQRQIRGDINFEQLYRNFKYLEKIQAGPEAARGGRGGGNRRLPGGQENDPSLTDPTETPATTDPTAGEDSDATREAKRKAKRERQVSLGERVAIRPFLLLRRGSVTYSEEFGTTLPGWLPQTKYLGLSEGFSQPGWDFVGGIQPDIRNSFGQPQSQDYLFQRQEFFASAITLNQQVFQTYSQTLAAQLTIEPFRDFKIDIDLSKRYSQNHSEFFKDTLLGTAESFARLVPADVGSYAVSYGALSTLFGTNADDLFTAFQDRRVEFSERFNTDGLPHQDTSYANRGYFNGFGPEHQEVVMASFLSTYAGIDPNETDLNVFNVMPKPNWRVSYNGLARLKPFAKTFTTFSLTHSYKSSLTVNSFNTNLLYDGPTSVNPATRSYFARLVIPNLVLTETFSPLIGVDARLKNEMSIRFSVNKARNLGMSFVDNTLAERLSEEWSFGYGYVVKNVDLLRYLGLSAKTAEKLQIKTGGKDAEEPAVQDPLADDPDAKKKRKKKNGRTTRGGNPIGNDLDLQLDVRFSDDVTQNRQLDQANSTQATRGSTSFTFSPSAEYEVNKQLSLRLFVDYRSQTPRLSTSFRTTNTQAGLTLRFKLN